MREITWAQKSVDPEILGLVRKVQAVGCNHWSRQFEYPWILLNGGFLSGQWVLDAAGGDGPLQDILAIAGCHVVNVDIDPSRFPTRPGGKSLLLQGDLRKLNLLDNTFQRVVCASVLEHVERPTEALRELWRVLTPGGRLVVTMDVASYARHNHTIDLSLAQEMVSVFGLSLPPEPPGVLSYTFPEIEPRPGEPKEVLLKVLCFYCDKT